MRTKQVPTAGMTTNQKTKSVEKVETNPVNIQTNQPHMFSTDRTPQSLQSYVDHEGEHAKRVQALHVIIMSGERSNQVRQKAKVFKMWH